MHWRRQKAPQELSLFFYQFAAYLELAKFKLDHILSGGKHKDGWEQFCVRLHLQEDNTPLFLEHTRGFIRKSVTIRIYLTW